MSELYIEDVEPLRDDGVHLRAVRVHPDLDVAESNNGAGVVVAAGDGGLDEQVMERVVKPLADAGYFVVALTLSGELADVIEDLQAALLSVKELARGKLGVLGLGTAATVALAAAAELPHLDAVVHVGGDLPPASARLSRVRASILVQHAADGSPMTVEDLESLTYRLKRSQAPLIIRTHEAAHGFFGGDSSEAEIAWDQTRQFFDATLT